LLSSLAKIAEMMNAEKLDASPILTSGQIATPGDISEISPVIPGTRKLGNTKQSIKKSG
jgi:hypothetical protein